MPSVGGTSSETIRLNDRVFWNPEDILHVHPGDCNAITQRGTRCRQMMFRSDDKQRAHEVIEVLSLLDPSLGVPTPTLEYLAFLTLCPRYHRKPEYSQVDSVVAKWKEAINAYVSLNRPVHQRNAIQHSPNLIIDTNTTQRRAASQPVTPVRVAAAVAREPTSTNNHQPTSAPPRPPPSSTRSARPPSILVEPHPPSRLRAAQSTSTASQGASQPARAPAPYNGGRSGVRAATPTTTPPATTSTEHPRTTTNSSTHESAGVRPAATATRDGADSDQADEPRLSQTNSVANSAGVPEQSTGPIAVPNARQPPSSLHTPPATPSPSNRTTPEPYVPRRRPLEDCSICMEAFLDSTGVVYCRAQCGQNFHLECMDTWREQQQTVVEPQLVGLSTRAQEQRRRDAVTCPYCRCRWHWNGDAL